MNINKSNYNIKRRSLTSGPHLFGTLLILAGVLVLVSPLIFEQENSIQKIVGVALGAIAFGLVIRSSYGGTVFNFSEKTYKEYSQICGFKIGEWTKLPTISKVRVISKSYRRTNKPNGISPTFSGEVTDYKLLLYSDTTDIVLSFIYSNKVRALKQAKTLADHLHAELILDI